LVLDSEGPSKLAVGDPRARGYLEAARARRARALVSAITLTEVLRGGSRDVRVHQVLTHATTLAVTPELARRAGERLGATGLSGHRCAVDSLVAVTALEMACPVVLPTSDPDDLNGSLKGRAQPKDQRVVVTHV
jgi:predicted nucleic acid-binding protein